MPRTLSAAAAAAILARETAEVLLVCLTIETDTETFRAVNDNTALVRTAGTFSPYPFEIDLPEDTDSVGPQVQLRVDNVDREVIRMLREYEGIPEVTVEVVLASDPDHVEIGPLAFSLLAADWDALLITATLGYEEDFLNQAVPSQTYTPVNSPGLFA